jgi:hypothetical protein
VTRPDFGNSLRAAVDVGLNRPETTRQSLPVLLAVEVGGVPEALGIAKSTIKSHLSWLAYTTI